MNSPLTLNVRRDQGELGPEWDALFDAQPGLQTSRAWLQASIEAALPAGTHPQLLAVSDEAGPLALVPMLAGPGRAAGSLSSPYTCLYQPLLRRGAEAQTITLREVGRHCQQWPVTRFEALDPAWPGLGMLRRSLASAGLVIRTFDHFGNWYEPITTRSWDIYLQGRPGSLRETIRRRTRAAERAGVRIDIAREGPALKNALEAYEAVYDRSWKQPEPYPRFNAALVRTLADTGVLRIGILWRGTTPIAAQYWSVTGGTATILKLAHDEHFKSLSPGTVLTAATIRRLIEADGVAELDFGRGDDPYKRNWASSRRSRIGLLALNPRTMAGMREWVAHDIGALLRGFRAGRRVRSSALSEAEPKPNLKD
ncbi:MAG: GNAT family N-acetyltransferase [Acetobacteraceae bacterium]|nr:GNAT family N-acetyltransferase [Acetobacteraceae bacterium]